MHIPDQRISPANLQLIELVRERENLLLKNPELIYPWWKACVVNVLLVTDGALDFDVGDFGLSAFVNIMQNDGRTYVRFNLTLAHLRSTVTDAQVMKGASGIARSIKDFRFDDASHFTPTMYDEVWLFGFETSFYKTDYNFRNTHRTTYPSDRLGNAELVNLSAHMNRGGGIFATGDHGALGAALCKSVNRVRSMRYWGDFPAGSPSEVSMGGPRRNDTNQIGHDPGSSFSDQSDDVPQRLDVKLYSTRLGSLRQARYPHPLLCSRLGRIDVFPDHPHEGECRIPDSLTTTYDFDGTEEYPAALDGSGRVAPEVIATSRVPAGNDARGSKMSTEAHSFGAISAYDGRRAGIGRVVCDATWHHFVNVNLIGIVEGRDFDEFDVPGEHPSKHLGFLSSPAGLAALAKIKEYYVNIGVWIAPTGRHSCFHSKLWWDLAYKHRIMEAALFSPDIPLDRISLDVLYSIGIHARDVLGNTASPCQTLEWLIDIFEPIFPPIIDFIDIWKPWPPPRPWPDPPVPWLDPMPLLDIAVGSALVSLRQAFPYAPLKLNEAFDRQAQNAALQGLESGLKRGLKHMAASMQAFDTVLVASRKFDETPKRAPKPPAGAQRSKIKKAKARRSKR